MPYDFRDIHPSKINNKGVKGALSKFVIAQTIISTFRVNSFFHRYLLRKTVKKGEKGVSFNQVGEAGKAVAYRSGNPIPIQDMPFNRHTVEIDDHTISSARSIDEHEKHLSPVEYRPIFARSIGERIAERFDQRACVTMMKAAEVADGTLVEGRPGGSTIYGTIDGVTTNVEKLAAFEAMLKAAKKIFIEKKIPKDGWLLLATSDIFELLFGDEKTVNQDYSNGNADDAQRIMRKYKGVTLYEVQYMPTYNINSEHESEEKYQYDATGVHAMLIHEHVAATADVHDVKIQEFKHEMTQRDVIFGEMWSGMNYFRPDCIVLFKEAPADPT